MNQPPPLKPKLNITDKKFNSMKKHNSNNNNITINGNISSSQLQIGAKKSNQSMINTRNKPVLSSYDDFASRVDDIAILMVRRDKIKACMDEILQQTREPLEANIAEIELSISEGLAICECYAIRNRATLLKGTKKSAPTLLATWSLKLGKEKLTTIGKIKWDAVVEIAKDIAPKTIRSVDEMDKLALAKLDDQCLAKLGVMRIPSSESFGVKPKDNSIADEPQS